MFPVVNTHWIMSYPALQNYLPSNVIHDGDKVGLDIKNSNMDYVTAAVRRTGLVHPSEVPAFTMNTFLSAVLDDHIPIENINELFLNNLNSYREIARNTRMFLILSPSTAISSQTLTFSCLRLYSHR